MKFRILEVGEPQGKKTSPLDTRFYEIKATTEAGTIVIINVPMCFTKRSIKLMLEKTLHEKDTEVKQQVRKGEVL